MDEGGTGGCNEIPKLDHKLGQLKDGITGVSNGIEVHQDSPKLEGKGQSKGLESKSDATITVTSNCNSGRIKTRMVDHIQERGRPLFSPQFRQGLLTRVSVFPYFSFINICLLSGKINPLCAFISLLDAPMEYVFTLA